MPVLSRLDTESAEIRAELLLRNPVCLGFFEGESHRLATLCREMARRFRDGGRLLAFGRGAGATDAQHVSVEFVHPVIVGKRALPALDPGAEFARVLPVVLQPQDIVLGFLPPEGDAAAEQALMFTRQQGALTLGFAANAAEYCFPSPHANPFVSQELFEILYHLLWETVHVYLEHREQGHDVGTAAFLYPFLGQQEQSLEAVVEAVRLSMLQKAREVVRLRSAAAETESAPLAAAAREIRSRLAHGGKILACGNGGSATDANDLAIDCIAPPAGLRPVPALSLASEPANLTAVANDIGVDALFVRQIIAHGRAADVAVAFSTSGSSANILSGLAEARRHGLLTVAFVGYDGGKIAARGLADHVLTVRSDHIPRIQEVQASLYHILRRHLGPQSDAPDA